MLAWMICVEFRVMRYKMRLEVVWRLFVLRIRSLEAEDVLPSTGPFEVCRHSGCSVDVVAATRDAVV